MISILENLFFLSLMSVATSLPFMLIAWLMGAFEVQPTKHSWALGEEWEIVARRTARKEALEFFSFLFFDWMVLNTWVIRSLT